MSSLYNKDYTKLLQEYSSYSRYLNDLNDLNDLKEMQSYIELMNWADENNIPEEKLPRDIKKLKNLTELDISSNNLTKLPESIGNLTNLTDLNIGSNKLTKLPNWIGNLTAKFHEILNNP